VVEHCQTCCSGKEGYKNVIVETITPLNTADANDNFSLTFLLFLYSAMEFLKQSDLLKIEDILPFFPDFVLIDDFKVCA
jgi:hypothetical protein